MSHLPVGIDWGIFGGYSLTGIFRVYSRYIANIPRISPGDNWGQCAVLGEDDFFHPPSGSYFLTNLEPDMPYNVFMPQDPTLLRP